MPKACNDRIEVVEVGKAYRFRKLCTGEVEVLAQRLGDGHTHLLHLLFEGFLQHGHAGAALGASRGACLQCWYVVVAVNYCLTDFAEANVVARAENGVVGQLGIGNTVAASRCGEVHIWLCWKFSPQQRLEGIERSGISHENTAEEGLGVAAGHDLLVHAARGVCEENFEAAFRGAAAVTEASDLYARELEFRGDIELFDLSIFVAFEQILGDRICHCVGGGNQTPGSSKYAGYFADGPDMLIACVARIIDENTAAFASL